MKSLHLKINREQHCVVLLIHLFIENYTGQRENATEV